MSNHCVALGFSGANSRPERSGSLVNLADATKHGLTALSADLHARLTDPGFPCTFVKAAMKKRSLWVAQVVRADPDCVAVVHGAIGDYLRLVGECDSPKEAAMIVLLLDIEVEPSADAESLRASAWSLLQALHEYDVATGHEWPESVPTEVEDADWAYCLHGVRLFVNMTSSELKARRSRNLGRKLTLVIQPTDGLHHIAPQNAIGDRIREQIRSRIDDHDDICRSPALNNAGADGNSDASQYWLGDTNDEEPWTPPPIPTRLQRDSCRRRRGETR